MPHFAVRTLTLNPSIDVSSETKKVEPTRKVRTCNERIDPGGGGINVARVLQRLGMKVEAIFLAGGATGDAFDALLETAGFERRLVAIADDTRTSLTIHERSTGKEYRFVPEGPTIGPAEIQSCFDAIAAATSDYFVASGSLPPGVPDDFYATVGERVRAGGGRFILDTSGAELRAALADGGIHLLKASREELDASAAGELVASRKAEQVALTCGRDGALLVNADGAFSLPSLETEALSTVGAGDSFLAGMTYGLAAGRAPLEAFRIAVAAGAAATLSPGTDLAYSDNLWRLLEQVPEPQRIG
ncbi:MAG: 1-phosphofructokinase family hexose kinase [Sphingomicrobium sp.]